MAWWERLLWACGFFAGPSVMAIGPYEVAISLQGKLLLAALFLFLYCSAAYLRLAYLQRHLTPLHERDGERRNPKGGIIGEAHGYVGPPPPPLPSVEIEKRLLILQELYEAIEVSEEVIGLAGTIYNAWQSLIPHEGKERFAERIETFRAESANAAQRIYLIQKKHPFHSDWIERVVPKLAYQTKLFEEIQRFRQAVQVLDDKPNNQLLEVLLEPRKEGLLEGVKQYRAWIDAAKAAVLKQREKLLSGR
jgi:hypothetical protein